MKHTDRLTAYVATITLASCGGGGGGSGPQYTIGGTVHGLSGSGLVLQSAGAGTLAVSSDGPFQFPTAVAGGTAYTVSVRTQPANPSQTCTASGATASGVVSGANVTNVEITCAAVANAARFVYVTNRGSNDISGYHIDNATGALTAINGSPFPAGAGPTWLTVHPSRNYAYVSNGGANTIVAYAIDGTSGGLTPIGGAPVVVRPFSSVEYPISPVVIDPSGNLAIVGNSNAPIVGDAQPDNLSVYHIDAASGTLAPVAGAPFSTNSPFPDFVDVDPAGKFVYAFNYITRVGVGGLSIASLAIEPTAGTVAAVSGSPFGPFQAYPQCYGLAPNGRFIYEGTIGGTVQAFIIDATIGALTAGQTASFVSDYCIVDPSSRFMYVTNGNAIAGYIVDSTTGTLTPISGTPLTVSDSHALVSMAIHPTGRFLYGITAEAIYAFAIDSVSGSLTAIPGSPLMVARSADNLSPWFAIEPAGRFGYVTSRTMSSVYGLSIDPSTGALTPVMGSPFTAGTSPGPIAFLK